MSWQRRFAFIAARTEFPVFHVTIGLFCAMGITPSCEYQSVISHGFLCLPIFVEIELLNRYLERWKSNAAIYFLLCATT